MNLSVFGLGYVGSVSAASFAADGHTVIGVDVNRTKVDSMNEGRSPIVEKGLDGLIAENVASGRLRATTDTSEAIAASDLSLVCVGTPSRRNGSLDLTYLERVSEQIGTAPGPTITGLAAEIARSVAVVLGEELRRAGADSGAAEPWAWGIVGMVHLSGDWWVRNRTLSRDALVTYLVDLLWNGFGSLDPRTADA